MKIINVLLIMFFIFTNGSAVADNEFGRFYTSSRQRVQLDELRQQRPQDDVVIEVVPDILPEIIDDEEEVTIIDSITLNGLVYRSDGKNSAWVNNNSTNEGNIETQFIKVMEQDVQSNTVDIILPDNQTNIKLKVGQQYDIHSQTIYDLVKDPSNPPPSLSADNNLTPSAENNSGQPTPPLSPPLTPPLNLIPDDPDDDVQ